MQGKINSVESFSCVDGAGIRSVIFFAGCNLRCIYCHNPEMQNFINYTEYSSDELLKKILKYKEYYGINGGVTFSGGEPLLQAEFLVEFAKKLKKYNIRYSIETAGNYLLDNNVKFLLSYADCVYLDIKFYLEKDYLKYTCGSLEKAMVILDYLESIKKDTTIRTVIVPELNDKEEDIERYVEILKKYKCIQSYELLPFHTMGFGKYKSLNMENKLLGYNDLPSEKINFLKNIVSKIYK